MVVNLKLVASLLSPGIFAIGLMATIPAIYSFYDKDHTAFEFLAVTAFSFVLSRIFKLIGKNANSLLTFRELFLFTSSIWFIVALITALPIYLVLPDIDYPAAFFETASAISTTGATAISHLQDRPEAILLWRSMLQFIGGIGFVVIAVAILPTVATGGMNLFKTESSSFDGDAKITPHVKTMAFALLLWYVILLILNSFFYYIGGMSVFVAINTAMCTVSTGGMMPADSSMNPYSPFIHYVAIVFMFLGSCPFLLLLGSFTQGFSKFIKNQQVLGYLKLILISSAAIALSLMYYNGYDLEKACRLALFNVVSVLSTTGFGLEDFTIWNHFSTLLFLVLLGIGGCSGSTSGGIKIFRLQVCMSMFKAQVIKTIHPHAVIFPRFSNQKIDSQTLRAIITFIVVYVAIVILSSLISVLLGLNISESISATITCLSNVGPAMGSLSPSGNFAHLSDPLHILYAFIMIIGRLEIIPVLLCLTVVFWKK